MNGTQWYYAQIRWAVMVDGKEGLRHWEEAVQIFLSDVTGHDLLRRSRTISSRLSPELLATLPFSTLSKRLTPSQSALRRHGIKDRDLSLFGVQIILRLISLTGLPPFPV